MKMWEFENVIDCICVFVYLLMDENEDEVRSIRLWLLVTKNEVNIKEKNLHHSNEKSVSMLIQSLE